MLVEFKLLFLLLFLFLEVVYKKEKCIAVPNDGTTMHFKDDNALKK